MSTPGERMAAEMAEQEAQELITRVEAQYVEQIQRNVVALEAEVRELRARNKQLEADFRAVDAVAQSKVEDWDVVGMYEKGDDVLAGLREELAVTRSAAESWAATAIAGEARERTAKEELARVKDESLYWGKSPSDTIADLRAQLQAAEAERKSAYDAVEIHKMNALEWKSIATTTTTLLQQARERAKRLLEESENLRRALLPTMPAGSSPLDDVLRAYFKAHADATQDVFFPELAAIDAQEKAGRE